MNRVAESSIPNNILMFVYIRFIHFFTSHETIKCN